MNVNIRTDVSSSAGRALLARWKRRQGLGRGQSASVDGQLVTRDGRVVPTPEEETVFQLLGMQPVPPERRSGEEWWRTVHRPLVSRCLASQLNQLTHHLPGAGSAFGPQNALKVYGAPLAVILLRVGVVA